MSADLVRRRRLIETARSAFPGGAGPEPVVSADVAGSWRRCAGQVAVGQLAPVELDDPAAVWATSPVRLGAAPILDELGDLAEREDYVAALTDDLGRILWASAGRSMRRRAERANFVLGSNWTEGTAGTNAPGVTLRTGRSSTVFASEHWCESVQDWVCYAAPVHDPSGRLIAVLDLSAPWTQASPLAEVTVIAMARLVEQELLLRRVAEPGGGLALRVLGRPAVIIDGRKLHPSLRQLEILTVLAAEGAASAGELQAHVYGDQRVSDTTVRAEVSHLRHDLGGLISSRPYRFEGRVDADVVVVRDALRRGDLATASACYDGPLLRESNSPFITDLRHQLLVMLRAELLAAGTSAQLLRFSDVHPEDQAVVERAATVALPGSPLYAEAVGRLEAW